jgi:hypothetical protein
VVRVFIADRGGSGIAEVKLERRGEFASLDGARDTRGNWEFRSVAAAGAERWTIESLRGKIAGAPAVFSGELKMKSAGRAVSLTATSEAAAMNIERSRRASFAGRGGGKHFEADWPRFADGDAFHAAISAQLQAEYAAQGDEFMRDAWSVIAEAFWEGGASWYSEQIIAARIAHASPTAVSVFEETWEYGGGAHGNADIRGRNFVLERGAAKEFGMICSTRHAIRRRRFQKSASANCGRRAHRASSMAR